MPEATGFVLSARGRIALLALLVLTTTPVSAAHADYLCRLNKQPWLACAPLAGIAAGAACRCRTEGQTTQDASGQVDGARQDELVYQVTSGSIKLSLGLDWISGPVIVLIPHRIADAHGTLTDAQDQQLADLYDFLHGFQNLQPPTPWPTPQKLR